MKIHRGPRTASRWTETDAKSAAEYAGDWSPGRALRFDGTIDKSGGRHTDLGVEIQEKDILALHAGLLRYYGACVKERDAMAQTISELEGVLGKLYQLVAFKDHRAPDKEALLAGVAEISGHFRYEWNRKEPFKSRFNWMKWKSL